MDHIKQIQVVTGIEEHNSAIHPNFTMFASGDVNILTESGMNDSLEDLESSQDFDGVGGQGETITSTDVMRES